jgi:hypothetical protein
VTLRDAPGRQQLPYEHQGYFRFTDFEGYPAIRPPWGPMTAIDLNRGEFVWQVTLGEHPELTARGVPLTGTENFGVRSSQPAGWYSLAVRRTSIFTPLTSRPANCSGWQNCRREATLLPYAPTACGTS